MSAIAAILSTDTRHPDPRGCDLPTCPVCADSMVAAEASAYLSDNVISYLWTCDTCGYGFVTTCDGVRSVFKRKPTPSSDSPPPDLIRGGNRFA